MPVLRLPLLPAAAGKQHWGNLPGAALSLAIAEAASAAKRFTLLLTADSQSAERLEQELSFFAPDLPVLHFPDWETLPYDLFSPHQDIISQRIASLYRLPELAHGVLVVPITTALHRLAPTKFLLGSSLVLDVGQKLDVEQMRTRLEASGYRCVDTVYEHGEFAVRGALIDLFPMGSKLPYRIDLFDDEIETLRTFDPENQRSIDKVDSIKLLPAREFPLQKDAVTRFKARFRERFDVDFRRCPIFQDLSSGITPAGIEYYLPLFFDETSTLFDYLPQDTQVFSLPGIEQAAEQFWRYTGVRPTPEQVAAALGAHRLDRVAARAVGTHRGLRRTESDEVDTRLVGHLGPRHPDPPARVPEPERVEAASGVPGLRVGRRGSMRTASSIRRSC